MPRDYKNIANKRQANTGLWKNPLLIFLSGLASGLCMALSAFLYYQNYIAQTPAAKEAKATAEERRLPKPTFDFYKILPDRKVNISEWVAEEPDREVPEINTVHVYVLQVGSFKKYNAADNTRGQLALMGIEAEIQRVVINGLDVRYRVRIGPYKNSIQLNEARQRLRENNLNFMTLKLKLDEDTTPG